MATLDVIGRIKGAYLCVKSLSVSSSAKSCYECASKCAIGFRLRALLRLFSGDAAIKKTKAE